MNANPYQAYKQQSMMTMTPGDMLTMLYDGLVKSLTCADMAFDAKDYTAVNKQMQKTQAILRHLQNTLDMQYEVAQELNELYGYFLRTALEINVKKDPTEIPTMIQMIGELKEAYVEADKKSRIAVVG